MGQLRIFQKGWNFMQDGPGNRLVYHLQGCNLHCPWCSNPEGMPLGGCLMVRKEKLDPAVCPHGAICASELDRRICVKCSGMECVTSNFNEGIKWSCTTYSCQELLQEANDSCHMFHGGGGVTLTGGEPTVQYGPVEELLISMKEQGINTVMETNGTHPGLSALFHLIDTLIIDFKHYDSSKALLVTGGDNGSVIANISRAVEDHVNLLIRITLIPEYNSNRDDIINFLSILRSMGVDDYSVEFLRYHEYGRVKWESCGMEYKIKVNGKDAIDVSGYEALFRDAGIKVLRT